MPILNHVLSKKLYRNFMQNIEPRKVQRGTNWARESARFVELFQQRCVLAQLRLVARRFCGQRTGANRLAELEINQPALALRRHEGAISTQQVAVFGMLSR